MTRTARHGTARHGMAWQVLSVEQAKDARSTAMKKNLLNKAVEYLEPHHLRVSNSKDGGPVLSQEQERARALIWYARSFARSLVRSLACWLVGLLACWLVRWLVGLLGCWVAGLLGCWVAGLLGCWTRAHTC